MKTVGLLAVVGTVIGALLLYFGTSPIPGALQLIGDNKTKEEIARSEWWRTVERRAGLALLIVTAILQAVIIYRQ